MTKLYLHVGMPKTGTSYIQSFFSQNRDLINGCGSVGIPEQRFPHNLACLFIEGGPLVNRRDVAELSGEISLSIASENLTDLCSFRKVFISSEYFHLASREKLVNYLRNFFDDICVVYTVRRQDKLLASGYNQDVKALGRTTNLAWSKFDATLNYFEACKSWFDAGCEINVISYDLAKKTDRGLERAFVELVLGGHVSLSDFQFSNRKSASNFSLSAEALKIKLALNRMGVSADELVADFSRHESSSREFVLPKRFAESVKAAYLESNKNFMAEFCCGDKAFEDEYLCEDVCLPALDRFEWDPLEGVAGIVDYFLASSIDAK